MYYTFLWCITPTSNVIHLDTDEECITLHQRGRCPHSGLQEFFWAQEPWFHHCLSRKSLKVLPRGENLLLETQDPRCITSWHRRGVYYIRSKVSWSAFRQGADHCLYYCTTYASTFALSGAPVSSETSANGIRVWVPHWFTDQWDIALIRRSVRKWKLHRCVSLPQCDRHPVRRTDTLISEKV